MKRIKRGAWRALTAAVLAVALTAAAVLPLSAASAGHRWYCVHVKDHVQPRVGAELAFVEELNGFYIDHRHGRPDEEEKVVYLTFDAGYENGNVEKILDVMKKEGVTGAFFILSHLIDAHPDLVRRMHEEGHLVCNHTARHKNMVAYGQEQFKEELQTLEKSYEACVGAAMDRFYRPPEGSFTRAHLEWASQLGYATVFWSFAYPDWDNDRQPSPERAKEIILENLHNGEVMLLHPTSATNAAILEEVIQTIRAEGYRFGSLCELVGGDRCDA